MSYPVVCLKSIESVGYIEQLLKSESHNGFPVVDVNDVSFPPTFLKLICFNLYFGGHACFIDSRYNC